MTKTTKTLTWTTAKRKVKDLLPAGYNPRKMTENERRDLEDSIKEFGTVVPVILNIGSEREHPHRRASARIHLRRPRNTRKSMSWYRTGN